MALYGFYVHSVTAALDLLSLRHYQSLLAAILPPKSLVLHPMSCHQDSRSDSNPARFCSQLWQMRAFAIGPAAPLQHSDVQSSQGCWQQRRYDFHLVPTCTTRSLLYYRAGQQDARQLKHVGLVAAANGSADLRAYRQGTGFVVTDEGGHTTLIDFFAPVGGPLASLRSEAAGIFSILQKVEARYNGNVQLMIFTDCLVLLLISSNWGHCDFWPDPGTAPVRSCRQEHQWPSQLPSMAPRPALAIKTTTHHAREPAQWPHFPLGTEPLANHRLRSTSATVQHTAAAGHGRPSRG